ncbi:MAG: radical SAM protein [Chlamydiota bacterium]
MTPRDRRSHAGPAGAPPRVALVSIEDGITALGFRRVASVARRLNAEARIYFVATGNLYSLATHLFPSRNVGIGERDFDAIAEELARYDLICFSSMTPSAPYVEKIAARVKAKNPGVFIIWGGDHCILYPDQAIAHVDAICTGEGERPFEAFYRAFASGKDHLATPGIRFSTPGGGRNEPSPLLTPADLDSLPPLFYGTDCSIYDPRAARFRPFTHWDYLRHNGLAYRTIWTIGCPFTCTYCANDAFLRIDKNYRRIRFASADHILEEIEQARRIYPFISNVIFYDDNFIAMPVEVIQGFAEGYRKRINLPFVVFGLYPGFITEEKIALLAKAGMNRGRMGIQSGSERTLAFYNRPTTIATIKESAGILVRAAKKYGMIPPSFDIISDNPVETRDDIRRTLALIYELERPFTLTVFSLRVFPGTGLWDYFAGHPSVDIRGETSSYLDTKPSVANILLYLLAVMKPPRAVFEYLRGRVRGSQEAQKYHPFLHLLAKSFYLVSRAVQHFLKRDFTTLVGRGGYYAWKLGLVSAGRGGRAGSRLRREID